MTFKKGVSGNPSGRAKESEEQRRAKEAIQDLLPTAAKELGKLINSKKFIERKYAIEKVLEYGLGKPPQSVKVGEEDGTALAAVLEIVRKVQADNA